MKRIATIITPFLLACFLFTSCSGIGNESDYTIRVSGTNGLGYNGTYMTLSSDGSSASRLVEGTVPAQYTVRGYIVSVVFQKQTEAGLLKVEILSNGSVIKSAETTAS